MPMAFYLLVICVFPIHDKSTKSKKNRFPKSAIGTPDPVAPGFIPVIRVGCFCYDGQDAGPRSAERGPARTTFKQSKLMIQLRKATIEDLPTLLHWDEQPHVLASDPNDDWQWETELAREPAWREQLIAELDGVPIGFVQIIDPAHEESHYWGDIAEHKRAIDIWIGEEHNLGKGYGTEMMRLALARCFVDLRVTEVLIDPLESNVRAIQFYERLGFEFVEKRKFGDDACAVYTLRREKWLASR
jgi:aminoglycoside 6'-N-acetyltransferase